MMLTFLQLSDIHFRGEFEQALDYDFREQLITDARAVVGEIGGASGILICGDIADKGAGSQFTQATDWLQNLCGAIGVDPWLVWVIPGNHDLTHSGIEEAQRRLRERVRSAEPEEVEATFKVIVENPGDREALLAPLHNYLEFAAAFDCAGGQELYWSEEVDIGAHRLQLRGLNSSLLCGPERDTMEERRMVIGERQAQFIPDAATIYYTLCHHPHPWLLDLEKVEECFADAVHFRVTGHVHFRWLSERPLGLYLGAGAVSPGRRKDGSFAEHCVPRYEVVTLDVSDSNGQPHLDIVVRGRQWSDEVGWVEDTEPNGSLALRFQIGKPGPGSPIPAGAAAGAAEISRPMRELRYRLARFQAYDREQCARQIEAPIDEVVAAPPHLQVEILCSWAERESKLPELWDAVIEAAQLTPVPVNPFWAP